MLLKPEVSRTDDFQIFCNWFLLEPEESIKGMVLGTTCKGYGERSIQISLLPPCHGLPLTPTLRANPLPHTRQILLSYQKNGRHHFEAMINLTFFDIWVVDSLKLPCVLTSFPPQRSFLSS